MKSGTTEAVGERVRELRKAREWTQKELAKKARLSRLSIVYVEGGHHQSISSKTLDKLARAFKVEIAKLMVPAAAKPAKGGAR